MAYTLRMMTVIENYLITRGCTIIGPMSSQQIPYSLIEESEHLPPMGLKRFVRYGERVFGLHVYVQDWSDRTGATLNIITYGASSSKTIEEIPNYYTDFQPAEFINSINLFDRLGLY